MAVRIDSVEAASDPLVSQSYADSWADSLVRDAAEGIDSALRSAFQGASGQSGGQSRAEPAHDPRLLGGPLRLAAQLKLCLLYTSLLLSQFLLPR